MDTQDQNKDYNQPRHNGRIVGGLFLLLVGAVFLLREMDFPFFPGWLFTWPMILIAVGIYTGIKHEFRNPGWLIPVAIGGIFLVDEMHIGFDFHRFIVPIVIIAVGFFMIVRPRSYRRRWDRDRFGNRNWDDWKQRGNYQQPAPDNPGPSSTSAGSQSANASSQDYFDSTSIFGGTKKVIVSKNFLGGDITCFMGGCEIDFTQADIQHSAEVDVTQFFGGTKLIVPPHWQIRAEMTAIFGSVEDKRQQPLTPESGKLLILKGTSVFGGIEIKNY